VDAVISYECFPSSSVFLLSWMLTPLSDASSSPLAWIPRTSVQVVMVLVWVSSDVLACAFRFSLHGLLY
jgi:hypothetical protein